MIEMSRTGLLAIIVWLLLVPVGAGAQSITDSETLRQRCATVQLVNPSAGLGCRGYIGAISDVLAAGNAINDHRACPPPSVKREELVGIVRSWLQRHPEALPSPAFVSITHALAEAFICARE